MRKSKLYLDTSFISHLEAQDTPEKMKDTLLLWGDITNDKYEVYLSNVTLDELSECPEKEQRRPSSHRISRNSRV